LPLSDYNTRPTWTECDESCQWWYNPNGPLLASAANAKKRVALYDIRDGEVVMEWDTNTDIASLENCYPVQWRDRGKLVLAEREAISVWDVNTMDVNRLQFIELPGKQISALYVHNSDAECSGGVRQRLVSF
jgi:WD40 repeat protein